PPPVHQWLFLLSPPRPHSHTLFPYTTLFRSDQRERIESYLKEAGLASAIRVEQYDRSATSKDRERMRERPPHVLLTNYMMLEYRSEEHTSELQSRENLVCRLLLEKKKAPIGR